MSLAGTIEARAAGAGDVLEFEGRFVPWSQIADAMRVLNARLEAATIFGPCAITVICRNVPGHVVALLALFGAGHSVRLLSADQPASLLAEQIEAVAASVVVTDETLSDAPVHDAIAAAGALRLSMSRWACAFDVVQAGRHEPAVASDPDTAIIINSSGTTGKPKPIPISRRAIEASISASRSRSAEPLQAVQNQTAKTRPASAPALLYAPLAHTSGIIVLLQAVTDGRLLVMLEKFDIAAFREILRRHRPKYLALFPAVIRMILASDLAREELSSLVAARVGTAALSPEEQEAFETRFGVPLLTNYGATEFIGAAASWTLPDHRAFATRKRGSVGRALADVELRVIAPDSGDVLDADEIGVLEVLMARMGPQWIRTTDLASIDSDGFLYIHGRTDDAIIRGGFKILASDVSTTLARHEKVGEAYVFGLADRRLGQVPVAVVEPKLGFTDLTAEELVVFARQHLPPYKVPAQIKVIPTLPRTISLKVKRTEVHRLFEPDGADHEELLMSGR